MSKHPREPHQIFFETLGNKTRWDIVHLLQKGPCRSTDIAEKLGYEQSLISHHLRRLETCGFVSFKQNGNERVYTLNKETIKPLLALMDKHINSFCKYCVGKMKNNLHGLSVVKIFNEKKAEYQKTVGAQDSLV